MFRCATRLRVVFLSRQPSSLTQDRELSLSAEPQPGASLMNEKFLRENRGKLAILTEKFQAGASNFEKVYKEYRTQLPIIEAIQNHVQHPENSRLVLHGSFASGLACDNSDLNFMFIPKDEEFWEAFECHNFKYKCFEALETLIKRLPCDYPELADKFEIERMKLVYGGTTEMTTFFKGSLAINIHFAKTYERLRTTNLVKHYNMADPRFGQLYYFLRSYLMKLGMIGEYVGQLTSLHVQYLIAHFLQTSEVTNPPVLPVLSQTHPTLVGRDLSVAELIEKMQVPLEPLKDWKSENTLTSGELVPRLVDYYANFDFKTSKIFISTGEVAKIPPHNDPDKETPLQLIDPYSNSPLLILAWYSITSDRFTEAIRFLHQNMAKGRLIETFPEFPEAEQFAKEIAKKPWSMLQEAKECSHENLVQENENDEEIEVMAELNQKFVEEMHDIEATKYHERIFVLPGFRKPTQDMILAAILRADSVTITPLLKIQYADDLPIKQKEFYDVLEKNYGINEKRNRRKVWNALVDVSVRPKSFDEILIKKEENYEDVEELNEHKGILTDSNMYEEFTAKTPIFNEAKSPKDENTSTSWTESCKYEEYIKNVVLNKILCTLQQKVGIVEEKTRKNLWNQLSQAFVELSKSSTGVVKKSSSWKKGVYAEHLNWVKTILDEEPTVGQKEKDELMKKFTKRLKEIHDKYSDLD